jgi:hypothetical protein
MLYSCFEIGWHDVVVISALGQVVPVLGEYDFILMDRYSDP